MGQVRISAVAQTPIDVAFAYVDDYRNVPQWMFGVTTFDPIGTQLSGLGANFDAVMQLGPKAVKSKIRVTEWERDAAITLASYEGMTNSSNLTFKAIDEEHTELTIVFGYEFPGGLAGKAVGRVLEPAIHAAIRKTEQNLRKAVEDHHRASTQD